MAPPPAWVAAVRAEAGHGKVPFDSRRRVTRWLSSPSPPLERIVSPHDIDHSRNEGCVRAQTVMHWSHPDESVVDADSELHYPYMTSQCQWPVLYEVPAVATLL
jgi:hypothetical protein